jgi:antitoxin (DNA-binding transcriptional repressor) of toxin-antitoxin stability system
MVKPPSSARKIASFDVDSNAWRLERRHRLDWRDCQSYLSHMKRASITQTKNGLSSLIDGLKGGEPVLIVDRGRPVARLEPVTGDEEGGQGGRLARLIRDGVLRPRRTRPRAALFSTSPPRAKGSAVELLINERRDGR